MDYIPSKMLDLKVALIISDAFRNQVYYGSVSGSCVEIIARGRYEYKQRGTIQTRNTVGIVNEELFVRGLHFLFKRVDTYKHIEEIRNKNEYDYILIPYSKIATSAEQKSRATWRLTASVEYQLDVKDAKTSKSIVSFAGTGSYAKDWQDIIEEWGTRDTYCAQGYNWIRNEPWYNLRLSEAYQYPIGNAMNIAFKNLLSALEKGLIPSELYLEGFFLDKESLLPNNILDAGEYAKMVLTVKNRGSGPAYGADIEIVSDNPKIVFEKNIKIGDIQPGETKDVKIDISAAKDIGDGKISFQLSLKEKKNNNAKKIIINISTSNQIDRTLDNIVTKIILQMRQKGLKRLAIVSLKPINSFYVNLHAYLLGEFYTRFGKIKEISVVETNMLHKALEAMGLTFSNFISFLSKTDFSINNDAVKKFGKLTGADTIFYWEISGKKQIKIYLVDADKGKIFYELLLDQFVPLHIDSK